MRLVAVIGPLLLFAFTTAGAPWAAADQPETHDPRAALQSELRADLEFLANDALRGRGVDDDTIHVAADHIAKRFREAGLNTALFDGTPYQTLEVPIGPRAGPAAQNYIRISHSDDTAAETSAAEELPTNTPIAPDPVDQADAAALTRFQIEETLAEGMNPMSIGERSAVVRGGLVFVGYGITAPELDYDDYHGLDVRGQIVAILRKEPGMNDPASRFEGTKTSQHAFFQTKIENAIRHGAAAVILFIDPASIETSVAVAEKRLASETARRDATVRQLDELPPGAEKLRSTLQSRIAGIDTIIQGLRHDVQQRRRGLLRIDEAGGKVNVTREQTGPQSASTETAGAESPTSMPPSIPVASLARDTFDAVLKQASGQSLAEIEAGIDRRYQPHSLRLADTVVELSVALHPSSVPTSNVLGELPGRGPLANETVVLGAHYDHVGMGGYGSLAPGTIAVHNGADDNASGTSAILAAASMLVERLATTRSHRRVLFIGFTAEERGLLGSKHYVQHPRFALESTVAMINLDMVGRLRDNELTVYGTGTGEGLERIVDDLNRDYRFDLLKIPSGYGPSDHRSFYEAGIPVLFFFTGLHNDYHRPTDKSEKIDYGGLSRITDMVCDVAYELARREGRPKYAETEKRVQIRRQLTAFLGVTLQDRTDHVVISGLTSGGPAERSGLRTGDRLDRLGAQTVRTAVDVLDFMRTRSPGDSLQVFLIRDGRPQAFEVRLDARPGG
ncbi:MAG: M28 family peptidase [Novipirellula sp. JB048]